MEILECPNCGRTITDSDLSSEHQQLILAAGSLVATAALMGLMMEHPSYVLARDGFASKMAEVIEDLRQKAEDMGAWGEAFDGMPDDDEE
jgi:hypothetical protein